MQLGPADATVFVPKTVPVSRRPQKVRYSPQLTPLHMHAFTSPLTLTLILVLHYNVDASGD